MENNRREFIKKIGATAAAFAVGSSVEGHNNTQYFRSQVKPVQALDKIRLGLIGSGIIGHYDTDTALKVAGTELVAVCDTYEGRLTGAKEKWGTSLFTTRDYRELLNRKDIDAVLICTPDHWHARIAIDALNAGKHVYCEKPMVQKIEDGHLVIAAHKKSGKVFQVGSQQASNAGVLEAKKYLEQGAIGELTFVEAINDRSNSNGAWNYSIPTDASPQTVDWDRFLGTAPKRPFDPVRYFRWRNYKDYGTGVAGDLFVHLITGLHTITGSLGPNRIFALGDLNYWKDGRDAYDLVTAMMDYPKTDKHPSFQFFTRVNLSEGTGGNIYCRLVGTEGTIDMGWSDFKIKRLKRPEAPGYGGYDSYGSFSAQQKEDFKKWYQDKYGDKNTEVVFEKEVSYKPVEGYNERYDHFVNFFNSIRSGAPVLEDSTFGLRAAGPSVACNLSVEQRKVINWDPQGMKIIQ